MSKTLALNSFLSFSVPEKNKKHVQINISQTRLTISLALIVLNAGLVLSYLLGVNGYASSGYQIQKLQGNIDKLTAENKKINLQVAEASSVVSIQTDYLNANFVSMGSAKFLQLNKYTER